MRDILRLAAVCGAALAPIEASAQSDAEKALAGAWEVSNAEHDKTCPLTFKAETTPGGLKLEFDRAASSRP